MKPKTQDIENKALWRVFCNGQNPRLTVHDFRRRISYVERIKDELYDLCLRHGIRQQHCGEDGYRWVCRHQLRKCVLVKIARLMRMIDQAQGKPALPLFCYWGDIDRPVFRFSSAAIGRWVVYYRKQQERRNER